MISAVAANAMYLYLHSGPAVIWSVQGMDPQCWLVSAVTAMHLYLYFDPAEVPTAQYCQLVSAVTVTVA